MILTSAAISIFLISYALIATERVHRVAAALGGVAGMVVIGLVDAESAFLNPETGVDWNVMFLLFGMMIIVGVLKQTGLFEFLALWAARASGGHPYKLLVLLVLVTATVAPILDNVTCVLLVAPVTLSVCRQLGLSPMPFLVSLILAANLTGPSTLIADPPNIIIASRAGLTFNQFLIHSLPLTVILLIAYLLFARLLFRRHLKTSVDVERVLGDLHPRDAITDVRLLVRCLVVLGLVMVAFSLHTVLHLDPSIVAMMGAGATVLVSRTTPDEFLEEVEWPTLAFFMALFVLIGSLVEVGVIGEIGKAAAAWMGDRELLGATALLFGSGVFGAFVDNIPYTTAMVPVVEDMVAVTPHAGAESPLWWAFVWGADLGGNATAVAAGANVVVLGIAAKAGQPISFWGFTKYGLVVTVVSLAIAWVYLYLRYFALA
ncbi:putative tyrosine transporter P-protein [Nocardioides albertanoniae]|uniref:Putative tyrosine transporter P-protein n=1 Tax=Nocardioides albertanoniae TaxID=1175486 RepID=A0A543A608_9ACTN|nr:ArsB/NhaD family transporter [Nocardioides albertanoniae]TQL68014.1 putative tyrosine transporter P-protein [Nocardioides albertanoniae]